MKRRNILCLFSLCATLALAACGSDHNVKEQLGLKSSPPDEFSVVTRAPLSVPPDYTLRPPRPGAERPMEISVRDQAKQTIFGASAPKSDGTRTGAQNEFLNKLGANSVDPNIRTSLDSEMIQIDKEEQPAAEKLLFWKEKEPRGKTIDPVEEQKRLDAESGKATSGTENAKTTSGSSVQKRNEDILKD